MILDISRRIKPERLGILSQELSDGEEVFWELEDKRMDTSKNSLYHILKAPLERLDSEKFEYYRE